MMAGYEDFEASFKFPSSPSNSKWPDWADWAELAAASSPWARSPPLAYPNRPMYGTRLNAAMTTGQIRRPFRSSAWQTSLRCKRRKGVSEILAAPPHAYVAPHGPKRRERQQPLLSEPMPCACGSHVLDAAPCGIPRRVAYHAMWHTTPCGIPRRVAYHAVWHTTPCGIPCCAG